eukprot:gene14503-19470_t
MSKQRPGTINASYLYHQINDENVWTNVLSRYLEAVEYVANAKNKPELIYLNTFWMNGYSPMVNERSPKHIDLDEVSNIMRWKLLRGKFRPLQKLVDSNEEELVKDVSRRALVFLDNGDWRESIKQLSSLKGIGVATASAILAPISPSFCPFMADEVMEAVLESGKRDYNMKTYIEMQSCLVRKADLLGNNWNAEQVGRALWTNAILSVVTEAAGHIIMNKPNLKQNSQTNDEFDVNEVSSKNTNKKRKRNGTFDEIMQPLINPNCH